MNPSRVTLWMKPEYVTIQIKATEFHMVVFIMLYMVVLILSSWVKLPGG